MQDTFKAKKVRVLLNHVLLTANRYDTDAVKDGIVDPNSTEGQLKEYQKVVDVGPNCCPGINVGDVVVVNFQNYARPVHSLNSNSVLAQDEDSVSMVIDAPLVLIDDTEYMFVYDRDIDMVVTSWEGDL